MSAMKSKGKEEARKGMGVKKKEILPLETTWVDLEGI